MCQHANNANKVNILLVALGIYTRFFFYQQLPVKSDFCQQPLKSVGIVGKLLVNRQQDNLLKLLLLLKSVGIVGMLAKIRSGFTN